MKVEWCRLHRSGVGDKNELMLARQVMLNCGAFDNFGAGCDGGDIIDVYHYMSKYGEPAAWSKGPNCGDSLSPVRALRRATDPLVVYGHQTA